MIFTRARDPKDSVCTEFFFALRTKHGMLSTTYYYYYYYYSVQAPYAGTQISKLPHQCISSQEPRNSLTGHGKAIMRDFES